MYRAYDRILLQSMSKQEVTKYIIKNFNVSESVADELFDNKLINLKSVRNALIQQDFIIMYRNPLISVKSIHYFLCEKYDVSFSHVRLLLKK